MGRKFGWRYPPGAANDPNAPYNQPDPPECPECGELVWTEDDHKKGCPNGDMESYDLEAAEESKWAEAEYDRRKEDGEL